MLAGRLAGIGWPEVSAFMAANQAPKIAALAG